jgi:phosphoribosylformylglycinamidine cyclo-ligase
MQSLGNIDEAEMFRTFNMGVGMVMMVAAADASAIRNDLGSAYEIGRVTSGSKTVTLV